MRLYICGLLLALGGCTGAPADVDAGVDGGVDVTDDAGTIADGGNVDAGAVVADAGVLVDTCTPLYDAYDELLSDFSGAGGVCEKVDECVFKWDDIDCVDASFSLCGVAMHVDAAADFDDKLASLTTRVCATGDGCYYTAECQESVLQCVDGRCVHQ